MDNKASVPKGTAVAKRECCGQKGVPVPKNPRPQKELWPKGYWGNKKVK